MIALIPMEIGPLATNQAAISVRQIQKFTTMAKTVQMANMHTLCTKNTKNTMYTLQGSQSTLHVKYRWF